MVCHDHTTALQYEQQSETPPISMRRKKKKMKRHLSARWHLLNLLSPVTEVIELVQVLVLILRVDSALDVSF